MLLKSCTFLNFCHAPMTVQLCLTSVWRVRFTADQGFPVKHYTTTTMKRFEKNLRFFKRIKEAIGTFFNQWALIGIMFGAVAAFGGLCAYVEYIYWHSVTLAVAIVLGTIYCIISAAYSFGLLQKRKCSLNPSHFERYLYKFESLFND